MYFWNIIILLFYYLNDNSVPKYLPFKELVINQYIKQYWFVNHNKKVQYLINL